MSRNNKSGDGGLGFAVGMILAVVAMPLVGIYLALAGESSGQKTLGVVLTIVGIIVWVKFGMVS